MVVFDASILLLLLDPDAGPPKDPQTGQPIENARERIEHLIAAFDRDRTKVLIRRRSVAKSSCGLAMPVPLTSKP